MPPNQTAAIQTPLSRDAWSKHIARWRTSKLTQSEYCQQNDLKLNSFIYQNNRRNEVLAKTLTLVPVKVNAAAAGGDVVLHGPKGWSLTMAADVSTAWLSELMSHLS